MLPRPPRIGLTATPKETKYVSNIAYFGDPVFSYSLKQGIRDGFLAPYKVVKVLFRPWFSAVHPPGSASNRNVALHREMEMIGAVLGAIAGYHARAEFGRQVDVVVGASPLIVARFVNVIRTICERGELEFCLLNKR